ncbi:beta strand repeat-containing protein, partial [Nitrospirillum amazonense]|uniref:beta strand repeat-containing protein n=1 Tax=Nitrospirillum amazonense TaxID=28077 RepID=UPI00164911C3
YVGTVLGSLNNSGTISASNAVYVAATGTLGSLTNTGTLLGANAALNNLGSIGTITIGTLTGTGTTTSYGTVGLLQGAVGMTNAGSIGTLVSYATIVGTTGAAVDNQGSMYSLGNAGTITGVTAGINNAGSIGGLVNANQVTGSIGINNTGTIGFIQNFVFATDSLTTFIGSISGSATGLSNAGVVGTLVNAGAITGSIGINNSGTVLGLANALFPTGSLTAVVGSIVGSATGVRNTGVIGTLLNQGLISGGAYALYNGAGATLGTVLNAGTISGNIANLSATDLVIAGGGGTLTGGVITNTASNVVFAGGTQVLNDALNVGSHTVVNSGASLALGGDLSITGNYSQATGTLALSTNHLFVSGVANVSGGAITASVDAAQNYVVGGSNGAILIQGGAGSSYTGVSLTSGVSGLTIAAGVDTIGSNVDLVVAAANDYIGGTLGSLGNSGTISGVVTAAYIATTGSLGTLANSGLLDGARYGIRNRGTIGLVDNSGTATGLVGLWNQGVIGTVLNTGLLKDAPSAQAAGLNNAGSIGVLTNMGSISSVAYGLYNSGSIGSIDNSGVISATDTVTGRALRNAIGATIAAISNSGTIAGVTALYSQGSVG